MTDPENRTMRHEKTTHRTTSPACPDAAGDANPGGDSLLERLRHINGVLVDARNHARDAVRVTDARDALRVTDARDDDEGCPQNLDTLFGCTDAIMDSAHRLAADLRCLTARLGGDSPRAATKDCRP